MMDLRLEVLPGRYAVARLEPTAAQPDWVVGTGFTSISRTPHELSVVCHEARVPDGATSERGFRCLRVAGPLPFSQTGVLASLAGPLAAAGIGILAVSTFDTDYLLVREAELAAATDALQAAGHRVATQR